MSLDPTILTGRQRQVYDLQAAGTAQPEICKRLGISAHNLRSVRYQLREIERNGPKRTQETAETVNARLLAHGRCPLPRCQLLEPHVCLGRAADLAQVRLSDPGGSR